MRLRFQWLAAMILVLNGTFTLAHAQVAIPSFPVGEPPTARSDGGVLQLRPLEEPTPPTQTAPTQAAPTTPPVVAEDAPDPIRVATRAG